MIKFIELTALRRNNEKLLINIGAIEYMLPIPSCNGTALISVTHHTKYEVQESFTDIVELLRRTGIVITDDRKMSLDTASEA